MLRCLLRGFAYAQHEWPSGILDGADGAAPNSCDEILRDVDEAHRLDRTGAHADYLDDFAGKVRLYQARFVSARNAADA